MPSGPKSASSTAVGAYTKLNFWAIKPDLYRVKIKSSSFMFRIPVAEAFQINYHEIIGSKYCMKNVAADFV